VHRECRKALFQSQVVLINRTVVGASSARLLPSKAALKQLHGNFPVFRNQRRRWSRAIGL
jgi:hypothetical protein